MFLQTGVQAIRRSGGCHTPGSGGQHVGHPRFSICEQEFAQHHEVHPVDSHPNILNGYAVTGVIVWKVIDVSHTVATTLPNGCRRIPGALVGILNWDTVTS